MKLPITLPFLIVCLVLASCVANKSAGKKTSLEDNGNRNPFVITSETEYTVYQILIEEMYVDDDVKQFVILSGTEKKPLIRDDLDKLPETHVETRDSFMNRNKQSQAIDCTKLELSVPCTLIDEEELLQDIFVPFHKDPTPTQTGENLNIAWDRFNDKYPGSPGLIWLSRIGFNTEGSQALVYVQQMVRILDGTSYLALLVRMDDTWVIHSAVKETPLDGTKFIEFSGRR